MLTFLLPLATISLTYGAIMRKLAKCDTFIVKYVSSGARDEDSWIRITLVWPVVALLFFPLFWEKKVYILSFTFAAIGPVWLP